jgi:hypothetical protein
MLQRGRTVSKKTVAYAQGRVHGIIESGWTCGDCGNVYDAGVDFCPNRLLDDAKVGLCKEQVLHSVHTAARSAAVAGIS